MLLHVLCDIRRSIFGVIVLLPLRGLSLSLPIANARFSQPSSVRSTWWSLIKPFPERSPSLGTRFIPCAVSHAPHTHFVTKRSFDKVTACVSHTENTTKLCCCGISLIHYLGHCCHTASLHCTACCAVLCELQLSLRCVLCGCTVTSRPFCTLPVFVQVRWLPYLRLTERCPKKREL
jgi:hypothetical protein